MQAADISAVKGSRPTGREPFAYARLRPWAWYALALTLGSITVFGGVAADPGGTVSAGNDDSSLFIWWLGHGAEVLAGLLGFGGGLAGTGDGFLYTEAMNALAGGVNGAWNTSLTGIAILLAPLTWVAGPIIAYNVLILSLPVLNSLACAILFRRFLGRGPAFAAAAGVGFSSYVIAQLSGHPNLAFAVTPPLVAALVLALLSGPRTGRPAGRRFWLPSIGLGVVLGFQFYVSTEVLAGTFLAFLCFLAALIVGGRSLLSRAGWLRLGTGGLVGAGIALLAALPLLMTMAGPNAPSGAIRPHGVWNTDLLDPIVPGLPTLFGTGESPLPRVMDLDGAEIGAYVGVPALVAAAIIVLTLGRRGRWVVPVRVAAVTGTLVFLLSLGSPVLFAGQPLLGAGPFALVEAIPVLNNILPMRLVLHSTIALWAVLGCGLQWALDRRSTRAGIGMLALLAVSAVVVMPGAQPTREVYVPDFYSGSIAEVIPEGSVVKTLPRPLAWAEPHADEAMVWQSVADFRYRETGGYFIGSSPSSPIIYSAPEDDLDAALRATIFNGAPVPAASDPAVTAGVEGLRADGVDFVVLAPEAPLTPGGTGELEGLLDAALGEPVFSGEGVVVYRVGP
ncbi:hypothetical protein [Brevibacterium sp. 2SA]|uniref:hypothetical protein n=1 Tax=Brevibacterium sp. 2SA TaxID=2502198 RepID=UPI0010F6111F|nr:MULTISPECIES: hypothetical protein [unclassified Brevibacterium]